MLEKNQFYEAEITDITAEGNGVCKINGFAVFVPDTAPGDIIKLKIVKVLKNYAFGIINEIILPSPFRIDSDCNVSGKCGGCIFRHISYEEECRIKDNIVKNAFRRIGGLDPEFDSFIASDKISRYRNKAQFPLAEIDGQAVCGFYAPRSHRVIPVHDCALQPEIFSKITACILDYINSHKISVYNEASNSGIMRHIYLRKGEHSGEIMVCFVVRKNISRELMPLCHRLQEKFSDIKSLVMNINPDKTNVILGKTCITLAGNNCIKDKMCGNLISVSPLSFYQVNTIQAERLYNKAREYVQPDSCLCIADLFCGAGTIGLSMADSNAHIIGIEIVSQAVENAIENARNNNILNADFYCGDAGDVFSELNISGISPDVVLIDPPRKGCSPDTLNVIANSAPRKIVMISCNPATAARDAKWLCNHGFSINKVCGADLFPRTGHVECVVLMSRKK